MQFYRTVTQVSFLRRVIDGNVCPLAVLLIGVKDSTIRTTVYASMKQTLCGRFSVKNILLTGTYEKL